MSELADLSLQDLMNLEVTSVSRRAEPLRDAAASIFVISGDDIRRSGATSLPEVLRLAPNLQVAQVSAYAYAISARGLASQSANKLLVLVDGRSVYTPLFSGVFWDVQDLVLEDIDRIEVISGPGGTLWGTNAVNGVINIITHFSTEARGGLAAVVAGTDESSGVVRYEGTSPAGGAYRGFIKYYDRGHTATAGGVDKDDASHRLHAGMRGDWVRGRDQFSVIANGYRGTQGQPPPGMLSIAGTNPVLGIIPLKGVNLLGRWTRPISETSEISVQAYYDRTERTAPPTFAEKLDIFDVQFHHRIHLARIHAVSWGGEYRHARDRVVNGVILAFLPASVNQSWSSIFIQDEVRPRENVRLTAGARVERNDYTGTEFLPNLRVGWNPRPGHLLWGAASRAVRAPSRLDRDLFVPAAPPFLLTGGPDVRSETALVYEAGYRSQPVASLSFSATLFRARYDHLRTQELHASRTSVFFANGMQGTMSGLELWSSYQVSPSWRVSAGFTGLADDLELKEGSNDLAGLRVRQGNDPEQSWRFHSAIDLPREGELDVMARHVSALENPVVPSYTALDIRYGWRPRPHWEISVAGRNLLGDGHGEFANILTRTEVGRAVMVKVVTHFGERDQ